MKKFLLFRIQQKQFCLDLPQVIDVRKVNMVVTESSSGFKQGIRTPEGVKLTMYDLSMLIAGQTAVNHEAQLMVVSADGAIIGLKVDNVSRVISVDNDLLESMPPVLGRTTLICFPMILKWDDSLIPLLDPAGIPQYELIIEENEATEPLPQLETVDDFSDDYDIIELTEIISPSPESLLMEKSAIGDEGEDEFLQTLDTVVQPDDSLAPLMEETAGLPPAEIISNADKDQPLNPYQQWTFLPKKEAELEQFFTQMVNEPSVSVMIFNMIRRLAETAVYREINRLKKQTAFFPETAKRQAHNVALTPE